MTAVELERPAAPAPADPPAPAPAPAPAATPVASGPLAATGWSVLLLAVLLLGFGLYLFAFSSVQESRAQTNLYKTFRNELALAVAPTGPTGAGAPVAILDIPQIGLNDAIVVEGTSAASLTMGPGHRVDTALPGQAGVSVLYGRGVTFGAPFGRLGNLRIGDTFTVTTGNGVAKFRVSALGTGPVPSNGLVLSTAAGEWQPSTSRTVIAELTSKPSSSPTRGALPSADRALASDTGAVLPLMLWSAVLAAVAAVATILRHRWALWPAYVCAAPVALAVLWNVYENAAQLLPNLY